MKQVFYLFGVLLLFACSKTVAGSLSQSDVSRVSGKYPGYTLANLQEGKTLHEGYCNRCHGLKDPMNYSEEQLNKIVPGMVKRVNKKEGTVVLDPEKEAMILKYMITMGPAKK